MSFLLFHSNLAVPYLMPFIQSLDGFFLHPIYLCTYALMQIMSTLNTCPFLSPIDTSQFLLCRLESLFNMAIFFLAFHFFLCPIMVLNKGKQMLNKGF